MDNKRRRVVMAVESISAGDEIELSAKWVEVRSINWGHVGSFQLAGAYRNIPGPGEEYVILQCGNNASRLLVKRGTLANVALKETASGD